MIRTHFFIRGTTYPSINRIIVDAGRIPFGSKVSTYLPESIIRKIKPKSFIVKTKEKLKLYCLFGKFKETWDAIPMKANEEFLVLMEIRLSKRSKLNRTYPIVVSQEMNDQIMGKITFELRTKKELNSK